MQVIWGRVRYRHSGMENKIYQDHVNSFSGCDGVVHHKFTPPPPPGHIMSPVLHRCSVVSGGKQKWRLAGSSWQCTSSHCPVSPTVIDQEQNGCGPPLYYTQDLVPLIFCFCRWNWSLKERHVMMFWRCRKIHSTYLMVVWIRSLRHASSDGRIVKHGVLIPQESTLLGTWCKIWSLEWIFVYKYS